MSFAGVSIVGDGKAVGHAINIATANGYHLLVVNGYLRTKATAATGTVVSSLPFMVGGHQWCIRFYPNGRNSECSDYISLFLRLVDINVTEALKARYRFSFVDELEKQDSACILAEEFTNYSSSESSWGIDHFMKREDLEKSNHLKNDCFTFRCDIAVATTIDLIKVPASSIQQHISDLLLSKEGTDVTFIVGDEKFVAHRCVLAARSAVFKAELFGPMKEGTVASVIDVEDMEASVFRAMLGFVYTDSLPKMEIGMVGEEGEEANEALWLQHLLAAADRYDFQRLKSLCEQKLCEHISVSSVTTILALAERHNCCGLKEICLEFVKIPANLKKIMAADGLDDIIRTCPSLVKELFAKFAS